MKKWPVTLSTTEPFNYIGIVNVRNGNVNSEILEATIVENGMTKDLTGCKVTFQTLIGGYPVERECRVVDAPNGVVEYIFDEYSMQKTGKQIANLQIRKQNEIIDSTQDFAYFVIRAVSRTPGEMGSYWQSIFDLIRDMTDYIAEYKSDFDKWVEQSKAEYEEWTQTERDLFNQWQDQQKEGYVAWFESIKDILADVDPGGKMLLELMEARVSIDGDTHGSISERIQADMDRVLTIVLEHHYTVKSGDALLTEILRDDDFSTNHTVVKIGEVPSSVDQGALVMATIDDPEQNVYRLVKVGEI